MKPVYPPAEDVADFSRSNPRFDLVPVAFIEHREADYPRIVRQLDVGRFPHGTHLYVLREKTMAVRAKFKCTGKSALDDAGCCTVSLEPVYGESEENKQFFRWTPSGQIQLGTINPAAHGQFEVGKEYYVDFTPAG